CCEKSSQNGQILRHVVRRFGVQPSGCTGSGRLKPELQTGRVSFAVAPTYPRKRRQGRQVAALQSRYGRGHYLFPTGPASSRLPTRSGPRTEPELVGPPPSASSRNPERDLSHSAW